MENKKFFLTIITPTYNRAYLLDRCFASLKAQTDKDFEWIIVDDGSMDNTAAVVNKFIQERPDFPIIFHRKEHGGKHTALNASHPYIHGQYVLVLDSDDYLTETAVSQVRVGWQRFACNKEIGFLVFLKGISKNEPLCRAEDEYVPVDHFLYKTTNYISGDCCEICRASLFRRYLFPVFEKEIYVGEGALWSFISEEHKCIYINQIIYIAEYLPDGLSAVGKKLLLHSPRGTMYNANVKMAKREKFKKRLYDGMRFACYGFVAKLSVREILSRTDYKGLVLLGMPAGWIVYQYYKIKYKV